MENQTAESRYREGEATRESFMYATRDVAKLLSYGFYRDDQNSNPTTRYPSHEPNQSFGELLFNNLVNTVMEAAWPATGGVFKFAMDPVALYLKASEAGLDPAQVEEDIDNSLSIREQGIMFQYSQLRLRTHLVRHLRHFLMSQALLYIPLDPKDNEVKTYGPDRLVTWRDGSHEAYEWVVFDCYDYESLPQKVQEWADENNLKGEHSKDIRIYTHGVRDGDTWEVYQELCGEEIPNTRETFKSKPCPWVVAGSSGHLNEHYRRGYCEKYYRDMLAYDSCEASQNQKVALLRMFDKAYLGRGRKTLSLREFFNSGPAVREESGNVNFLREAGAQPYELIQSRSDNLARRLSQAFLLTTGLIRDAERVTAAEIQMLQRQVQMSSVSAEYSTYQEELMVPVLLILNHRMERANPKIEKLPKEVVPVITTGLEALSRSRQADELLTTTQQVIEATGQGALEYLEMHDIAIDAYRNRGQNAKKYVLTREEVQQQRSMEMIQQAGAAGLEAQASQQAAPQAPPQ